MAYNDAFRILFDLPRYTSARTYQIEYKVTTFDALLRNLMFSFVNRCLLSNNLLINSLVSSTAFLSSDYYRHYAKALY